MNRRERLELKLSKREEWAGKAEARSAQRFAGVQRICDGIPFGQPILVGHHSEGHARADQARIHNGMSKACELADLAQHHAQKASGLERQLKHSIFSDDDDAIANLEQRIVKHEAQRDRMKQINAAYRKGDAAALAVLGLDLDRLRQKVAEQESWLAKTVYPAYALTNLGARIRSDKERIEQIRKHTARTEQAAAAGGMTITTNGEYTVVTFAEKPDREFIDALKDAGFRWRSGSWYGPAAKLPAGVQAVAA